MDGQWSPTFWSIRWVKPLHKDPPQFDEGTGDKCNVRTSVFVNFGESPPSRRGKF